MLAVTCLDSMNMYFVIQEQFFTSQFKDLIKFVCIRAKQINEIISKTDRLNDVYLKFSFFNVLIGNMSMNIFDHQIFN